MEEKEILALDFGKTYTAGNFEYYKSTRALSGKEMKRLREESGIPKELWKKLPRGGIPYLTVTTHSRNWSVSFVAGTTMFSVIENAHKEGNIPALQNLFLMMYADTSVMGDSEYWDAKTKALNAFMERQEYPLVTPEEEQATLDDIKRGEELKENITEAAETMLKEESDGE